MYNFVLIILMILIFPSCTDQRELTLYITPQHTRVETASLLKKIIENNSNLRLKIVHGDSCSANIENIKNKHGDLSLCDNSVDETEGVSTLSLIFPKVLQIFYKRSRPYNNVKEYLEKSTMFLGEKGGSIDIFLKKLFEHFTIPIDKLKTSENPWDEKVNSFLAFGPLIAKEQIVESFKGYQLLFCRIVLYSL